MLCDDREEFERRLAGVSMWHVPSVSATDFAAVLGLAVGSVRQYRSTDSSFPAPAVTCEGKANLWTLAQVYDYCPGRASHRLAPAGIPRVYPMCSPTPASSGGASHVRRARFVAAECIPNIYRYAAPGAPRDRVPVVQYWSVGDDRGMLAVVYLSGDAELDRWDARDLAVSAARYLHERDIASAAVVITDEDDREVPNLKFARQRTVIVAEVAPNPVWVPSNSVAMPTTAGRSWRPSRLNLTADPPTSVYDVGLYELRYLLRRDLPCWPVGWRPVDEMAGWRPAGR